MNNTPILIFFGTSEYAVIVLEKLIESGYIPALVITTPDKPAGKHLVLTPSPVKVAAEKHDLDLFQPENLNNPDVLEHITSLQPDLGIVVAYGKIITQKIIDIPKHGILNVHASLLPKLRGASPIETAILNDDKATGVTIMQIDNALDHGPIIAQQKIADTISSTWPPQARLLGEHIVNIGAQLLVDILPDYLSGKITQKEQDHSQATFTKKIEKVDGLIDLSQDAYENFRKIQAYHEWPTTYFFVGKKGKKIRVIIKKAAYDAASKTLQILSVVPEGKKETDYKEFLKSLS